MQRSGPGADSPDEWRALFLSHYPGLVRHLTYLLGDRAAAEDIAQETFLRLLRHPLRRGGDPEAWLRVVGVRLAYNYLRGERRRRGREDAAWTDPALRPVGATHSGEDAAVRAALDRVPPRDRMLLLLRAAGRPYAEIASAIGVRPTSVGTLLARATAGLRREYVRETGDAAGAEAVAGTLEAEGVRAP